MTIWAIKAPSANDYSPQDYNNVISFLSNSIRGGVSRFGWSYHETADLIALEPKAWASMSEEEKDSWRNASFLLNVQPGDWVVHINIPYWGACLAAEVTKPYTFEEDDNELSDFRHTIEVDPATVIQFERNDPEVLPVIGSRLKLQGRYWRIQHQEEFLQTLENLKIDDFGMPENEAVGVFYLKKGISPLLKTLTANIQKCHPGGQLERFMAEVIRKVPNVVDVYENGRYKGFGTDNGADLIVTYKSGLNIGNLEKEEKLVVQVKSYINQHWETNAVAQIEKAIIEYEANAGLIISTAESTDHLEQAVEETSLRLKKPISLLTGEDVARFVLNHGGEMLL